MKLPTCQDCGKAVASGVISESSRLRCADCAQRRGYPRAAARLRGEPERRPGVPEQMGLV